MRAILGALLALACTTDVTESAVAVDSGADAPAESSSGGSSGSSGSSGASAGGAQSGAGGGTAGSGGESGSAGDAGSGGSSGSAGGTGGTAGGAGSSGGSSGSSGASGEGGSSGTGGSPSSCPEPCAASVNFPWTRQAGDGGEVRACALCPPGSTFDDSSTSSSSLYCWNCGIPTPTKTASGILLCGSTTGGIYQCGKAAGCEIHFRCNATNWCVSLAKPCS